MWKVTHLKIYNSAEGLIGGTPLVRFERFCRAMGVEADICGKLEYLNPAGSVKDRAALYMLNDAEKKGLIGPGSVIIEPTSGNTGIGLAAIGAIRGYRTIIVMPDTMSAERRMLMTAYGAELVLTDGEKGMAGSIEKAKELASEIPGAFIPGQFENPANPMAHFETTGPELVKDTDGKLAAFVAGAGTGGTVSGTGRYLKCVSDTVKVFAVEPKGSPVLSGGKPGKHGIQGIGGGFVPDNMDLSVCDEVITVSDEDAFATARLLARTEGVLVGISSGAALWAAAELAKREEFRGKLIAALLPDTGDRYLSTGMFG
ncbi:MAG: cysteine synthase A [Ruminococcaceae bacterium]|nr:cysteine synthase A [Oscillospiraceae bacterium]